MAENQTSQSSRQNKSTSATKTSNTDQNKEPKEPQDTEIYPWMTEYRAKGTIFISIITLGKDNY